MKCDVNALSLKDNGARKSVIFWHNMKTKPCQCLFMNNTKFGLKDLPESHLQANTVVNYICEQMLIW